MSAALKFGGVFLLIYAAAVVGQRTLDQLGFYVASVAGGVISSASAVASAGNLAAAGALSDLIAGRGALIASVASALVNLPIVMRVSQNRVLTRRIAWVILLVAVLGVAGSVVQPSRVQ